MVIYIEKHLVLFLEKETSNLSFPQSSFPMAKMVHKFRNRECEAFFQIPPSSHLEVRNDWS